jgi:hypothetical protein
MKNEKLLNLNKFLNDFTDSMLTQILLKINFEKYKNLDNYKDLKFDSSIRKFYIKYYPEHKNFNELQNHYKNNN